MQNVKQDTSFIGSIKNTLRTIPGVAQLEAYLSKPEKKVSQADIAQEQRSARWAQNKAKAALSRGDTKLSKYWVGRQYDYERSAKKLQSKFNEQSAKAAQDKQDARAKAEFNKESNATYNKLLNTFGYDFKRPNNIKNTLPYVQANLAKAMLNVISAVGSIFKGVNQAQSDTDLGNIANEDVRLSAAMAHKQLLAAQNKQTDLINRRNKLLQQFSNDERQLLRNKEYNDLNQAIDKQNRILGNRQLKELNDTYMADYINDNRSFGENIEDAISYVGRSIRDALTDDPKLKKAYRKNEQALAIQRYQKTLNQQYNEAVKNGYKGTIQQFGNEQANAQIQLYKARKAKAQKAYETDQKDLQWWHSHMPVSKEYELGSQAYANASMLNRHWWNYTVPATIGSSMSSPKQAIAMGIQGAGMLGAIYADVHGAPFAAGAIQGASTAISAPFQYMSAQDENLAEIGGKRYENLYNKLQNAEIVGYKGTEDIFDDLYKKSVDYWTKQGATKEWIAKNRNVNTEEGKKALLNDELAGLIKSSDPRLAACKTLSLRGLRAQYQQDMMRTASSLPVEIAMQLGPEAKILRKATGVVFDNTLARLGSSKVLPKAVSRAAADKLESRMAKAAERATRETGPYKHAFKSAYNTVGGAAEQLGFGYPGKLVAGTVGGAINTGARMARNMLSESQQLMIEKMQRAAVNKFQKVYDKLFDGNTFAKLATKYGLSTVRRIVGSSLPEAAEEGVQYLNSRQNGDNYGYQGVGLFNLIANDMLQGGRVLNTYLAAMGLSETDLKNDAEFWQNVKGGAALGGLHTGVLSIPSSVRGIYNQYQTDEAVKNSAIFNRQAAQIERAQGTVMAQQAMQGRSQYVVESLEEMKTNDGRRAERVYSDEMYDEQINKAQGIASLVKNKKVRAKLEAKGFTYGTREYATAIADLYNLQEQRRENTKQATQVVRDGQSIYNDKDYNQEADDIAESLLNDSVSTQLEIARTKAKSASESVKGIERLENETDAEYALRLGEMREKAAQQAENAAKFKIKQIVKHRSQLLVKLQGLLEVRAKLNNIEEGFTFMQEKAGIKPLRPDAKAISDNIDEQIKQVKSELKDFVDNKELDLNASDEDLLKAVRDSEFVINHNRTELVQLEQNRAILDADRAVIDSYLQMYDEDLVESEDGGLEYNPEEYRYKVKQAQLRAKTALEGKEYKEGEHTRAKRGDVKKGNRLANRIKTIQQVSDENERLDWMVAEIYSGDAVARAMETDDEMKRPDSYYELSDEDIKEHLVPKTPKEAETKPENTQNTPKTEESANTATTTTPENARRGHLNAAQEAKLERARNRRSKLFEARRAKAKRQYERAKKRYKNWRRGNLNASIIPFQDAIVNAANTLMYNAKVAAYKFDQFVQDIADIVKEVDIKDVLPVLKQVYIKQIAKNQSDETVRNNMSTAQEVLDYQAETAQPVTAEPTPQQQVERQKDLEHKVQRHNYNYRDIVRIMDEDRAATEPNNAVNSYWNTFVTRNGVTKIAFNDFAINERGLDEAIYDTVKKEFQTAKTPEEALTRLIERYNFEDLSRYASYLGVTDIQKAITLAIQHRVPSQSVQLGAHIRSAIIKYVLYGNAAELYELCGSNTGVAKSRLNGIRSGTVSFPWYDLPTEQNLIVENEDGTLTSVQIDLMFVDNRGDLYIFDVASSYKDIRQNLDNPISNRISKTKRESFEENFRNIASLISKKFQKGVSACWVIPVTAKKDEVLVENRFAIYGADSDIYLTNPAENVVELASDHEYEDLNISIANTYGLLEELRGLEVQLTGLFGTSLPLDIADIPHYIFAVNEELDKVVNGSIEAYTNSELTKQTLHQVSDKVSTLRDEILKFRALALAQISSKNSLNTVNVPVETLPDELYFSQSPETRTTTLDCVEALSDACRELDREIDNLPDAKVTNDAEKSFIQKIGDTIARAQFALGQLLNSEDGRAIDVSDEQKVIAEAIEKLALRNNEYGEAGRNIRKWWISEFAGNPNNYAEYVTSLQDWVSLFSDHILTDISDNINLQIWYSTVLHNYLQPIIDKAEKFNSETEYQLVQLGETLGLAINQAKELIAKYDELYGVAVDNFFNGVQETPLERVNRMAIKYDNLYGTTDAHTPAWTDMNHNPVYFRMSNSPTFLTDCKFNLWDDNGVIKLNITEGEFYTNLGFQIQHKDGSALTEAEQKYNKASELLIKKVKAMLELCKANPNLTIKFDVFRNKGSVIYDSTSAPMHSMSEFLFADSNNDIDTYKATLSKDSRIGILAREFKTDGTQLYGVFGGPGLKTKIGNFDDVYKKQKLNTASGQLVFFYDTGRVEDENRYIGVTLNRQKIGDRAVHIARLLWRYTHGQRVVDGYDIQQLLNMSLYMYDPKRKTTDFNNIENRVSITDKNTIMFGTNEEFDLANDGDIKRLIDRITGIEVPLDINMLSENITSSTNSIFVQAKAAIQNTNANSVTLPNGMLFTRDDFEHKNADGTIGSTYLGTMLRNGTIGTRAVGRRYTALNIRNLVLVDKNQAEQVVNQSVESEVKTVKTAQQLRQEKQAAARKSLLSRARGGLTMVLPEDQDVTLRSTEESRQFVNNVVSWFNKVIGNSGFELQFEDADKHFLSKVSKNARVLGICTDSMIKLSMYAPDSVIFHEAFHKIMELVLDDATREKFYSIYRKYNGAELSDREVAEGLTDMFVAYMANKDPFNKKGLFGRVKNWFKSVGFGVGMAFKFGIGNTKTFLSLYRSINHGDFTNREVSAEKAARFNELFGEGLYYEVKNPENNIKADLQFVENSGDLRELVNSITYHILRALRLDREVYIPKRIKIDSEVLDKIPTQIKDELRGVGIPNDELDFTHLAFRELFKSEIVEEPVKGELDVPKTRRVYPNFEAISRLVSDNISNILGSYGSKIQLAPEEFDEDEEVARMNIDKYDRASFEFNKLDSATQLTKLFLGTIPYCKFDTDGKIVPDLTKSKYGTPVFMPLEEVANVIQNDLHDIKSMAEFNRALQEKAKISPMYAYVAAKFYALYSKVYTWENGKLVVDYDKESQCIQIFNTIKSNKNTFDIARAVTDEQGNRIITIAQSHVNRDARMIPARWQNALLSGQTNVFSRMRDNKGNYVLAEGGAEAFSSSVTFIENAQEVLNTNNSTGVVDGVEYNLNNVEDLDVFKDELCEKLRKLGINFTRAALDYMLANEYGNQGVEGLAKLLSGRGETSVNPFLNFLKSVVNEDGSVNQKVARDGFSKLGFIKQLGSWQGSTNLIQTSQSSIGLDGKSLNTMSQNNSITHTLDALNLNDPENEEVAILLNNVYGISSDAIPAGSIVLKALKNKQLGKLKMHTYIGFKTDNLGDEGVKYQEEPDVEDYLAKLSIVQNGYLILPTMSDKSTWGYIEGVDMPGVQYVDTLDNKGNSKIAVNNVPTVRWINDKAKIIPAAAVTQQMIEYAKTEMLAIQHCMDDLGYNNIPSYTRQRTDSIKDSEKVKNYHIRKGAEPNGTRFISLSNIVVPIRDANGHIVDTKTINLNNPKESSIKMLKLAQDEFFNKDYAEQQLIMALTLNQQYELEVERAEKLGVVTRRDVHTLENGTQQILVSKSDKGSYANLDSELLNEKQIQAVTEALFNSDPVWSKLPLGQKRAARIEACRGLAIATILADATTKHIISAEECTRLFIGNPAFFKVEYSGDHIANSAGDIQKRIGSMISTGDDNASLIDLDDEYTCAEIYDYEIGSASKVAKQLPEMFRNSVLRELYAIYSNDSKAAYSLSLEEIEKLLPDNILHKGEENAKVFSDAFKQDINVADGSAFITDKMYENMLRMRGAYNKTVKKAFDILRDPSTKYSWQDKADAYKLIYNKTDLVTTKYTAYGIRAHNSDGNTVTDVAVPYCNKFALFPIFPCMATGKLNGIYQKMLDEGVDMALMTSAVKVGSQGAVHYNGKEIPDKFNKYTQNYAMLRRQLNTDSEEHHKMALGTQMVKIVLSNLNTERLDYTDPKTGKQVSGKSILDNIMGAINKLAQIGENEILDMFYDEVDGNYELSTEKLSQYLLDQMSSRNSNKNTITALDVVTDQYGNKRLASPLAATSDASWIESILISTINKRIIDIQTPGNSFVQRSVFATDSSDVEGGSIQSDANLTPTINGGKRLEMWNDKHCMDAVISIDYFEDILPRGLSFNEAKQWLIDNNIIGQNADANTVAYRIPTQAQSSIHALRFVDVVPAVKSTVILPEEFTKITGSDYDIDHLYLASYNYNKIHTESEDGSIIHSANLNIADKTEDGTDNAKYYQNELLRNMITLLSDENTFASLYRSIDSDTQLIKDVADQIKESGTTQHIAYNFGTLHEQTTRKNDYITGKFGIGPFALNVTGHQMSRLYKIEFKDDGFIHQVGMGSLHRPVDNGYNAISSWLSGFINAHVDIVKDPYISKLNVNKFSYNLVNLLTRTGKGEAALWFTCQPVIRDIAEASNKSESQLARTSGKSAYAVRNELIAKAAAKYGLEDKSINDLTEILSNPKMLKYKVDTVNYVFDNMDAMAYFGSHPESKSYTTPDGDVISNKDFQQKVFIAYKALEPYMNALNELVQFTKIDTRKQGNTFIAMHNYLSKYEKLVNPRGEELRSNKFNLNVLQHMVKHSWIDFKTHSAILDAFEILGKQTFTGNVTFLSEVRRFCKDVCGQSNPSDRLLQTVARHYITAIKGRYISEYAKQRGVNIKNLLVGDFNMNSRLNMLKSAIADNPEKYGRLANNALLNQISSGDNAEDILYSGVLYKRPEFIQVNQNADGSRIAADMLIDGWNDLLGDEDVNVRNFAKDLIVYAFVTSGESKGWGTLFKFVPQEWIQGIYDQGIQSFSDYIYDQLNRQNYEDLSYEVAQNNYMDSSIIKRIPIRDKDGNSNFIFTGKYSSNGSPTVMVGTTYIEHSVFQRSTPSFITVKRSGKFSENAMGYDLYIHVSNMLKSVPGKNHPVELPVYALVQKKGYDTGFGKKVYQYGFEDNLGISNLDSIDQEYLDRAYKRLSDVIDKHRNILDGSRYTELQIAEALARVYVTEESTYTENGSESSNTAALEVQSVGTRELSEVGNTDNDKRVENLSQTELSSFDKQELEQMRKEGEQIKKHCKGE